MNLRLVGDDLELIVSNDGPTLPPEIADSLFDPMVSSTRDARETHLGLGLYIVRRIAEAHGGKTRVESSADAGTTFFIVLPR